MSRHNTNSVYGFSALQRAENSSIVVIKLSAIDAARFQCSSASRKFLNGIWVADALVDFGFQCSSASRKFLNRFVQAAIEALVAGFSALQRAENSSIVCALRLRNAASAFQCSSASRKFLNRSTQSLASTVRAFQCSSASRKFLNRSTSAASPSTPRRFSALQRAENSSILERRTFAAALRGFSALQRAENSSIGSGRGRDGREE